MPTDLNLLTTKAGGKRIYGIDASSANKEKRTGVENYCRELIQAMKNHQLEGGESVVLYSPDPLDDGLARLPQGWTSRVLKWPPRRGWMSVRMGWEMLRRKPGVLFVPGQALPLVSPLSKGGQRGVAVVTTVHDLAFARRPDLYEPATRRRLARVTKKAIKKATKIIVPSQATKQDLVEFYRAAEGRIAVIPEAADTTLFRRLAPEEARPVLDRHRLGAQYFLLVGRLEKKKNIANMIRAFELFKSRRGLGDPFELILVGEPGFGWEEIKRHIDLSGHKDQIRSLGYLPDEDVAALMSRATAFLFPSWYEGFGIPNLEAMAAGAPVIASNLPVHREVAADAALLVPAGEPEDWAQAMARIVQDQALRESLIAKGIERAKSFSWETAAQQTWEVLRSLV